jgi:hypothetical protein
LLLLLLLLLFLLLLLILPTTNNQQLTTLDFAVAVAFDPASNQQPTTNNAVIEPASTPGVYSAQSGLIFRGG